MSGQRQSVHDWDEDGKEVMMLFAAVAMTVTSSGTDTIRLAKNEYHLLPSSSGSSAWTGPCHVQQPGTTTNNHVH